MNHSQLDITYPDTPFIYDSKRPNEVFKYKSENVSKKTFIYEVANISVNKLNAETGTDPNDIEHEITNDTHLNSIEKLKVFLKYLSELDTQLNDFEEVRYSITYQDLEGKLRFVNGKKNFWLNLHTQAYGIVKSSDTIDTRLDDIVSWCIIPILGNTRPFTNNTIQYGDIQQMYKDLDNVSMRTVHESEQSKLNEQNNCIVDNRDSERAINDKMARYKKRRFVKRHVEKKKEKPTDKVTDANTFVDRNTILSQVNGKVTNAIKLGIRKKQALRMTKAEKLRINSNAGLSRNHNSMLINGDMIGNKTTKRHNDSLDNTIHFLNESFSEYRVDKVKIDLVRGVWRFLPQNSGRIVLDVNRIKIDDIVETYIEKAPEEVVEVREDEVIDMDRREYVSSVANPIKKRKFVNKSGRGAGPSVKQMKLQNKDDTPMRKPAWIRRNIESVPVEQTGDVCGGPIMHRDFSDPEEQFTRQEKERRKYRERHVKRIIPEDNKIDVIVDTGKRDTIDTNARTNNVEAEAVSIDGIDIAFVTISRINHVLCLNLNTIKI
jgi:hypothetical protein